VNSHPVALSISLNQQKSNLFFTVKNNHRKDINNVNKPYAFSCIITISLESLQQSQSLQSLKILYQCIKQRVSQTMDFNRKKSTRNSGAGFKITPSEKLVELKAKVTVLDNFKARVTR
jgi:hypothetical protein